MNLSLIPAWAPAVCTSHTHTCVPQDLLHVHVPIDNTLGGMPSVFALLLRSLKPGIIHQPHKSESLCSQPKTHDLSVSATWLDGWALWTRQAVKPEEQKNGHSEAKLERLLDILIQVCVHPAQK